jgi:hypothetical protein
MAQPSNNGVHRIEPATWLFADDGLIPNNPALPLVIYRGAIDVAHARDPAALFEAAFACNGWGQSWRNGIYPFVHYHSMCHEVLGIARGGARVRFGGPWARSLMSTSGTSRSCRPAPATSVSRHTMICWSSGPIRLRALTTFAAPHRATTPVRVGPSPPFPGRRPIRSMVPMGR